MNEMNGTWIGIIFGGSIIAGALLWNRLLEKERQQNNEFQQEESATNPLVREPLIQEKIRQIALIEQDEFDHFYRPFMEAIMSYLRLIENKNAEQFYFESVFKALRKRRSAIFERGSSEQDQKKKALWTFALFCALSIRCLISQLQKQTFTIDGKVINPYLQSIGTLAECQVNELNNSRKFKPGLSHVHLIDKLLDASLIDRFESAGIYPFIINAVCGYYYERNHPFYSIIEHVEAHMAGTEPDDRRDFEQNIRTILGLIECNTFSKNAKHSFVFEGMSYLLIDRNFLWELYRGHAVAEHKPLGKKDFEAQLVEVFHLGKSLENNTIFTFTLEGVKLDESQESLFLELRNMVALPYKAVTYYQFTDRRKIKKHTLQRDITSGDVYGVHAEEQATESSLNINKSRSRAKNSPEGPPESMGLKDLFSDSP